MKWHIFIPGVEFIPADMYQDICETLIDEGILEIVQVEGKSMNYYKWRIKSPDNKIVIKGKPGQILKIRVEEKNEEKDNSKIECVA